jgi:polar amino acid transport system substrate-binding protein
MPFARLDKRTFLLASFWGVSLGAGARPLLTISTNNTPSDRKALEQLATEAFRRLDLGVQIVNNPSERSLVLANQGEVDGEGLRVAGLAAQYPHLIQVPERFIGVSFVAFTRQPGLKLEGWSSLQPHRVGFITGWKMFEAHATGGRVVNRVDTPEQLFKMLAQDRIDVALYTLADGLALVQRLGLSGIQAVTPSLRDVDMYLYLHQRHSALVPRVAQALRDMKTDGTHARLLHDI